MAVQPIHHTSSIAFRKHFLLLSFQGERKRRQDETVGERKARLAFRAIPAQFGWRRCSE